MKPRLPAEWEPVQSVLLTWPHLHGDWADSFTAIHNCYLDIVTAISPRARIIISAADAALADKIRNDIGMTENVSIYTVASDDTWVRDHGPICIYEDTQAVLLDFIFNGWGNKYPSANDNLITQSLYNAGAFPGYDYEQIDFVLEGGSIDTDGQGTLLTTKSCLLAESRNPGLTQAQVESELKKRFGVKRILWLENSELAGDDTDGHIDMLARFADPQTITYTACDNEDDPNYLPLQRMKLELENLRQNNGERYNLLPLVMPEPIYNDKGEQLPASYSNFLIVNDAVLLPTYGVEADKQAIRVLTDCFPKHQIIGVACRALIEQFGSLHCATMQLPQ